MKNVLLYLVLVFKLGSLCRICFREEEGQWVEDQKLDGHSDWVRDVAWAPSVGLPKSVIASCSQVC